MVRFEKVFFRQLLAAVITAAVHTMIFKDLGMVLGVYLFYVTTLCLQDWMIDLYRERRNRSDHGYRNETGRRRKSA